ncbi:unnamed protein product [Symbiodinium sp. CCMP2592]|nr:unnamed protein product [Symbiodinium sp. CCMP2592]
MKDGRPITVFSNIYRLWSSICSRSILRAWAAWLPTAVAGSVPGRSVRDVSLTLQAQVEAAIMDKRPLAGVSVDIIKCFNQIPRAPLVQLLRHLHVPESVISLWQDFLSKALRHAVFLGEIGLPTGSTTGVPEGCPLSVLCMVALCWYLASLPRPDDLQLYTYVDNLSGPPCSVPLKLHCGLLPNGAALKVVSSAKDLGVQFRFQARGKAGAVAKRLEEGRRRLSTLQSLCRPLLSKARLIQASVWPAALYGMEGSLVTEAAVQKLRSSAARAMLGDHSAMSPVLALSALTPTVDDPEVFLLAQYCNVLQTFDEGLQVHLARVVVGALLSDAAKATWDRLQSPLCQFCGAMDTKHHRVLQCPATAVARKPFLPLLQILDQESPEWFHCPFPSCHASEPFLRLLWHSRKVVAPPRPELSIPSLESAGEIHFFTDGTCAHPTIPEARHAAWAVLVYIGPFAAEWLQQQWRQRDSIASCFAVVAQGVVPGQQTISRAEVLALCQAAWVAQSFPQGQITIWSDSQTALKLSRALQQQTAETNHFASDLIADVPAGVFESTKLRRLYSSKGRPPDVAQDTCAEVAAHYQEQHDRFLAYCQYQVELLRVAKPLRAEACREQKLNYQVEDLTRLAVSNRWNQLQLLPAVTEHEETISERLSASRDYKTALKEWSSLLVWPSEVRFDHAFIGVTFLELMINFIVCAGMLPRVGARSAQDGVDLLSAQGILQPVVLRELVVSFIASISWSEKAERCTWFDSPPHRRIRSLEFAGLCTARKGLLKRPVMPRYGETIRCAYKVLTSQSPGETLRDAALQVAREQ